MEAIEFYDLTEDFFEELLGAIETADKNAEIDAELQEGVLNVTLEDGSEFVINRHEPTMQIWYSSPETGASKFEYKDDDWISTDEAKNSLLELFQEELEKLCNISIQI